jgi:putative hydrolase of the HAD superfamily/hydrolase
MIKPNPEIFELMAERLGVQPNECLMIDDIAANIAGAEAVGMEGVIFTSNDELQRELSLRFTSADK